MDDLTGLLDGPRARHAFAIRSVFDPPWALRIQDRAPLTLVVMVRDGCWVRFDDAEPIRVGEHDVALLRGPDPYTVSSGPDTEPDVVIHPGQVCTDLQGNSVSAEMALGVRTWGTNPLGSTVCLTGAYSGDGEVGRRLLTALPRVAVLRRGDWVCPYIDVLSAEMLVDAAGQDMLLDRLLDVLLIRGLREWFDRADVASPAWLGAQADPVAGPALRLLHADPARPWTVESLARQVGASRALLARRFTDAVGEPPMSYLADWRLTLAADLLREPDTTVGAAARAVGYRSPFTFSTAFKRRYGVSPSEYRTA